MATQSNNLELGAAQALENLHRSGVRLVPRGDVALVAAWLAQHGAEITAPADENQPGPMPNTALPIQPTALPQPTKQPSRPRANVPPQPIFESVTSSWQTQKLSLQDRVSFLQAQAETVTACTMCTELVCSRTKTVYGVGNVTSPVVFVGEGPGHEEDRTGEPFVGAAGQLLNKIITAMTLQRENVYIMNAVKCRPQGNRTPTDDEIGNCQKFFVPQLETIQPKFIVCLGAVAARAVLQTTLGIGRLRGRFHAYRGAQVVVTYHPAYLLRNPDAKKLTWEDMQMLMKAMGLK